MWPRRNGSLLCPLLQPGHSAFGQDQSIGGCLRLSVSPSRVRCPRLAPLNQSKPLCKTTSPRATLRVATTTSRSRIKTATPRVAFSFTAALGLLGARWAGWAGSACVIQPVPPRPALARSVVPPGWATASAVDGRAQDYAAAAESRAARSLGHCLIGLVLTEELHVLLDVLHDSLHDLRCLRHPKLLRQSGVPQPRC